MNLTMLLVNLAINAILITIRYLNTPKPPKVKPASESDLQITTAGNGHVIPKVAGTIVINACLIVRAKNFRTEAIKSD